MLEVIEPTLASVIITVTCVGIVACCSFILFMNDQ